MSSTSINCKEAKRLLETDYTIEEDKEEKAVLTTREIINSRDIQLLQKIFQARKYEIAGSRKSNQIEITLKQIEEENIKSENVKVLTPNGNSKEYDTVEEAVQDDDNSFTDKDQETVDRLVENKQDTKHSKECKRCGEKFNSNSIVEVDEELDNHWEEEHGEENKQGKTLGEYKQEENSEETIEKQQKSIETDSEEEEESKDVEDKDIYIGNKDLTVSEVRKWDKEKLCDSIYELMNEEEILQAKDIIKRFWNQEKVETNSEKYNIVYSAISKLSKDNKIRREGRGEYKVVKDDRPEYLPEKAPRLELRNHSEEEIDNMKDCELSEILLHLVAEKNDKTSLDELLSELLNKGEDSDEIKFRLIRVLDDYLNGAVVKEHQENNTFYDLGGFYKDQILEEKPSLYQVLNSDFDFYKCQECEEEFEANIQARRHRRNEGHFNWEGISAAKKKLVGKTETELEW